MPPKKSYVTRKRAASPASQDKQPVSKRTRAQTTHSNTEHSSASHARPKPKMRPPPPHSSDAETQDEPAPTGSKKKAPEAGLRLASVGGRPMSGASAKGKARNAPAPDDDEEYGEEEIDELADDVDVLEPSSDDPPMPTRPIKKVTLRISPANKPQVVKSSVTNSSKPDTPEPEPAVAKISFSVEKDGVVSRPIDIPAHIDFETFTFRVAQAFGEVAGQQDLLWKTDRMPKSAKWRELENTKDFKLIMELADSTLQEELDKFCTITATNNEGKQKAKSKGKTFVPKPIHPLTNFVILLRDRNQERKLKEAKSSKKEKKPAKNELSGRSEGLAQRILACKKVIEDRECPTCGKCCVILPGGKGSPAAIHKELSKGEIQAWAHAVATAEQKGEKVSLENPPDDLLLQWSDHKSASRGKKSDTSGSKTINNPPPSGKNVNFH